MDKRIEKLTRDPFVVDLGKEGGWWFVEPRTGNTLFGSALLQAWRGHRLTLKYSDFTYEIVSTDDTANWVEAVNAFLATKRTSEQNRNGVPAVDSNVIVADGVNQAV